MQLHYDVPSPASESIPSPFHMLRVLTGDTQGKRTIPFFNLDIPHPIASLDFDGTSFHLTGNGNEPQNVPGTSGGNSRIKWVAVYSDGRSYMLRPIINPPADTSYTIYTQNLPPDELEVRNGRKNTSFKLHCLISAALENRSPRMKRYRVVEPTQQPDKSLPSATRKIVREGRFDAQTHPQVRRSQLRPDQQKVLDNATYDIIYGRGRADSTPAASRRPDALATSPELLREKIIKKTRILLSKMGIKESLVNDRMDLSCANSAMVPRKTLTDLAAKETGPEQYILTLELTRLQQERFLHEQMLHAGIKEVHIVHSDPRGDTGTVEVGTRQYNPVSNTREIHHGAPIIFSIESRWVTFTGPLSSLEFFLDVATQKK